MKLHIKDFKKHYTGEWDFNQLHQIALLSSTEITIPFIGNEELVFLQALEHMIRSISAQCPEETIYIPNIKTSYISYLRDDKDIYSYSKNIINKLIFKFITDVPPHEPMQNIEYRSSAFENIINNVLEKHKNKEKSYVLGADRSVKKFFGKLDSECQKVRCGGEIISFNIPKEVEELGTNSNLIIVDDILGGGGTIKKIIEKVNPEVNITVIVGFTEDLEDFSDYPNVSLVAMTSLEKLKKMNRGE